MKAGFLPAMLLVLSMIVLIPTSTSAEIATTACDFVGGFQELRDLIPDVVGECLENEHFDSSVAGTLQRTSRGFLVWRKIDNLMVFTDGTSVWVAGPSGVKQLRSDEFQTQLLNATVCVPVGQAACLVAAPETAGFVQYLATLPVGRALLQTAADAGVVVRFGRLPSLMRGRYDWSTKVITLQSEFDFYGDDERAALLAHELQHAADHAAGVTIGSRADCLAYQERAFKRQSEVWSALRAGKPGPAQTPLQHLLDTTAEMAGRFEPQMMDSFLRWYGTSC